MQAPELFALMALLAQPGDRPAAGRRVAAALGARDLMVLSRDPETDAFLPVLGLRKTLPGGPQWRQLLKTLREPGVHRMQVPAVAGGGNVAAVACTQDGTAMVLVDGEVSDVDARLVCTALPLVATTLRTQQALAVATGELAAARCELKQSAALMKALDEARSHVDRTLVELDAQARSLEEARTRAEAGTLAKDRFMAMLGHELRNPLAPIVTALELLRHRGLWSHEHDIMQRQVGYLMRLVNDLLDMSRITGGKLVLQPEPVEIATVIGRALEITSPLLDQRRHQVDVAVAERGLCVSGDVARLAQVFSNLLTNAAKYSDPGTSIAVTARRHGDMATVEVADQGIGIDPELLESVFGLFEQQGRGIDRAQGGLGLGLTIVRNLVVQHGGNVRAHSVGRGRGSRFVVELPLSSGDACLPSGVGSLAAEVPDMHGNILLVDDNEDAASTLAMGLRLSGFEVRTAADGLTALRLAAEFQPDVALLDIGLPVMDGYELARRLRAQCAGAIRLVALTGYGQRSDRVRAQRAGFDAHLVKPVDFADVLQTLNRMLSMEVGPGC